VSNWTPVTYSLPPRVAAIACTRICPVAPPCSRWCSCSCYSFRFGGPTHQAVTKYVAVKYERVQLVSMVLSLVYCCQDERDNYDYTAYPYGQTITTYKQPTRVYVNDDDTRWPRPSTNNPVHSHTNEMLPVGHIHPVWPCTHYANSLQTRPSRDRHRTNGGDKLLMQRDDFDRRSYVKAYMAQPVVYSGRT